VTKLSLRYTLDRFGKPVTSYKKNLIIRTTVHFGK